VEWPVTQHQFLNPPGLLPGQGFSHVTLAAPGQLVCIAGQTAHQPDGRVRGTTMAEQADAALENLAMALGAAGALPEHVVELQIFVTDVGAYRAALAETGTSWQRHLGKHYPSVSLFGIKELFDPDALIEIVARAIIPNP
jgi:enamine deaminase RidA (YjgF/YER057c/UK114 family)